MQQPIRPHKNSCSRLRGTPLLTAATPPAAAPDPELGRVLADACGSADQLGGTPHGTVQGQNAAEKKELNQQTASPAALESKVHHKATPPHKHVAPP